MYFTLSTSLTIFSYFLYFLSQTNGDVFKGHEGDHGKHNDFIQDVIRDLLSDPEAIKVSHLKLLLK